MDGIMQDFRKQIVQVMKRRGLSAYALAKAAGLPLRNVQLFVSGTQDTTSRRLARLCKVLGLELRPTHKRNKKA